MKILSIGFRNPFFDSGYINDIKINRLNKINVFISENNSGKARVLRSIYHLLLQDIDRSLIFRRLKVMLDTNFFEVLLKKYHNLILQVYKNRNATDCGE